jgi:hypothetical protein
VPTGPWKLEPSLESFCMSRLRLLLFWLLVLVVPLQGFAATTKLLCDGARGAHGLQAVDAAGERHVHSHNVHAHSGLAAHMGARTDAGTTATSLDSPAHQCGLCAACCHAVGPAHEYQPVFGSPAPQADIPEVAATMPSRSMRLPEKPPRT